MKDFSNLLSLKGIGDRIFMVLIRLIQLFVKIFILFCPIPEKKCIFYSTNVLLLKESPALSGGFFLW